MACISMPTAMLISGGVSALGGVANAVIGGNAATQAASTQANAAKTAQAQTLAMYGANKDLLSPYINAGNSAMTGVTNLLGGGSMNPATTQAFLAGTPGYQFTLQQGLQATQNGFAAKGLGSSGAAIKGAGQYAEGLAGTQYQNIFGNFLDTARLGEGAASAVAGMGAQSQQQINDLITGGATATAAGQVGSANALMGGIGNVASGIGNTAQLMGLYGNGSFGGTAANTNSLIPNAAVWNSLYGQPTGGYAPSQWQG